MKRALVGVVPDEHLNRRPKPDVATSPTLDTSVWPSPAEIGQPILGSATGIVAPDRFLEELQNARLNRGLPISALRRTLSLESWLHHLTSHGVLTNPMSTGVQGHSHHGTGDRTDIRSTSSAS